MKINSLICILFISQVSLSWQKKTYNPFPSLVGIDRLHGNVQSIESKTYSGRRKDGRDILNRRNKKSVSTALLMPFFIPTQSFYIDFDSNKKYVYSENKVLMSSTTGNTTTLHEYDAEGRTIAMKIIEIVDADTVVKNTSAEFQYYPSSGDLDSSVIIGIITQIQQYMRDNEWSRSTPSMAISKNI